MNLIQLSEQLANLENYVRTLRTNKQPDTSPIVNTEGQDSTSSQEHPLSKSKNWESRTSRLEANWTQFQQNNDKTIQETENLLTVADYISNERVNCRKNPANLPTISLAQRPLQAYEIS